MRHSLLKATQYFPTAVDWSGLWAIEPTVFARLLHTEPRADQPRSYMEMTPGASSEKRVAIIRISGVMTKGWSYWGGTSTSQVRRDIRNAANDPNVSGIMLAIDSPGGSVAGQWELVNEVGAARQMKPVRAWIQDLGASAGYWLAAATDRIDAGGPMTEVGSIGTFMAIADYSVAAEREGIKVHMFKTGELKGLGTPGTVITEQHQAHMQSRVDAVQPHFDGAVKRGRGMTDAQLSAVRTGGVFPATAAIGLKLIDGIQSFEAAVASLAKAK